MESVKKFKGIGVIKDLNSKHPNPKREIPFNQSYILLVYEGLKSRMDIRDFLGHPK